MKQRVAIIGYGAISQEVLRLIQSQPLLKVSHIVVRKGREDQVQQQLRAACLDAAVVSQLPLDDVVRPDLLVECAGHAALEQHVLPALRSGMPAMVVSVGALSESGMAEQLEAAAQSGNTQVQLLSGAIGGIDALAAARYGGLDSVTYIGRKPPSGWWGSAAEGIVDLHQLKVATRFFEGSARDAARDYPKNANVAATLSLAGIGLDRTRVELFADPSVTQNIHYYEASGVFGHMSVTLQGNPLASNPKTSALTVYSIVRALNNRVATVVI